MCPAFRGGTLEDVTKRLQFAVAADERRLHHRRPAGPADLGRHLQWPPGMDGLDFAFEHQIPCVFEGDRPARRPIGSVVDEHRARRSCALQTGRGVDEVTGHALTGRGIQEDRGFARGHSDPNCDVGDPCTPPEHPHLVGEIERGAHRPLCVVLVGDRRSPHAHDRVADELVDRSAVPADHISCGGEEGREEVTHLLGVAGLRHRRIPNHVGEQHRDQAAFGDVIGRLDGATRWIPVESGPALTAEPGAVDERAIARGAPGLEPVTAIHAELLTGGNRRGTRRTLLHGGRGYRSAGLSAADDRPSGRAKQTIISRTATHRCRQP